MSRPLKYRFPAGDIRKELPDYFKVDGFRHPLKDARGTIVSETRLNELGILMLIEAVPIADKVVTKSHGELIGGKWTEIIDEQKTSLEIAFAAETAKQAAKSDELKQAENGYFGLIDTINNDEELSLAYSDNVAGMLQKSASLSMTKKAYYGMLLQAALVEVGTQGGAWKDLPAEKHVLT